MMLKAVGKGGGRGKGLGLQLATGRSNEMLWYGEICDKLGIEKDLLYKESFRGNSEWPHMRDGGQQ